MNEVFKKLKKYFEYPDHFFKVGFKDIETEFKNGMILTRNTFDRKVQMKPSKFLAKWVVVDRLVEALLPFVSEFDYKVEVTSDITHYYQDISTQDWTAGSKSCMDGWTRKDLELYYWLGCKLLVIKKGSEVVGRAIYWDNNVNVIVNGNIVSNTYVDRVYAKYEDVYYFMRKWCIDNARVHYHRGKPTLFTENLDIFVETQKAVDLHLYEKYPFMDTMKFGMVGMPHELMSHRPKYSLYDDMNEWYKVGLKDVYKCKHSGQIMGVEDAVYVDYGRYEGEFIHSYFAQHIDFGLGEGNWVYEDDVMWSDENKGYCLK